MPNNTPIPDAELAELRRLHAAAEMDETLKELSGDLQEIHESLERAEAVGRQLGVCWREFAEERDQLRAEVERLRGELDFEKAENDFGCGGVRSSLRGMTARAEAAESTVAGLRRALDGFKTAWQAWPPSTDGLAHAVHFGNAMEAVDAALAASPDDHERRIKAEALRSTAAELEVLRDYIQTEVGPDDARDDIRRICWNRAKDLREEADRLEAENGR